jgi:hypothetical protein
MENAFATLFSHRHQLWYLVHSLLVISILVSIIQQLSLTICEFSNRLDKRKQRRLFIVIIFLLAAFVFVFVFVFAFAFATAATTGTAWCCADTSTRGIRRTSAIDQTLQGRLKHLVVVCHLPKVQKIGRPLKFVMHELAFHQEIHGFFVCRIPPDLRCVPHHRHHPKQMTKRRTRILQLQDFRFHLLDQFHPRPVHSVPTD